VYIHLDKVMLPYIWVYNVCVVVEVGQVVDCYFSWEHYLQMTEVDIKSFVCLHILLCSISYCHVLT